MVGPLTNTQPREGVSTMKKAVVAIDHSAVSRSLMDYAFNYAAREKDAALYFVHVIEPEKKAWPTFTGKVEDSVLRKVKEEVGAYVKEALEAFGQAVPNVSVEIRTGTPYESILDYAEEVAADMIMIGHRSRGAGPRRFFLGSVAAMVVAHSSCSVYVHRPRILAE